MKGIARVGIVGEISVCEIVKGVEAWIKAIAVLKSMHGGNLVLCRVVRAHGDATLLRIPGLRTSTATKSHQSP